MTSELRSAKADLVAYRRHIQMLYERVQPWCKELGLAVAFGTHHLSERRHGEYEVPTLAIANPKGNKLATLVPQGEVIVSALGRVDLMGASGRAEKFLFLREHGYITVRDFETGRRLSLTPDPKRAFMGVKAADWYWVPAYPVRRAWPLTLELFVDVLTAVSDEYPN